MPNEQEVIKPYEGPPPTPENFGAAFPELMAAAAKGIAPQRGRNPLDPESTRNLEDLRRRMRMSPPKPATVINLHPWPLSFGSSNLFLRGIVVPACNPGMDIAYHHIRSWSHDKSYNEDGMSFKFTEILPIHKAAQFLVAFADPEVYGGGVIVYEGEGNPSKMGEVECYNPDGRPLVTSKNAIEYDDEDRPVSIVQDIPVRRKLADMITEQRTRRNEFYMARVEWADSKFKSTDVKERRLITPMHRLMAEVLHAEGILPVVPEWNLSTRMEQGLAANNCKGCGNPVAKVAFKCLTCAHILNPLEAYLAGAIEFGHGSMDTMTVEDWEKADSIKADRDQAREEARSRREKATAKSKKA